MKTYSVDKNLITHFIGRILKKDHVNSKLIGELLIETLESDHLTLLLNMILGEEEYKPLERGKFYIFEPESYDLKRWDLDKLRTLGLLENNSIYCKLKDSDNYGGEFKPFHNKFIVDALVTNEEGDIIAKEMTPNILTLVEITDQEKIKYLNSTKYFSIFNNKDLHSTDEVLPL